MRADIHDDPEHGLQNEAGLRSSIGADASRRKRYLRVRLGTPESRA
jgi:hypothetical protein